MGKAALGVLIGLSLVIEGTCLSEAEGDLVFTSILYRHGDRSPLSDFQSNPVPITFWSQGLKQLTQVGMQQHYYLGKFFHQRYALELNRTYLFNNYTRTQIYVRSTDVDRTLMSAQCQLSGLFKPDEEQAFLSDLSWQPIPVHTVAVERDSILRGFQEACPKYREILDNVFTTPEVRNVSKTYQEFFNFLEEQSGMRALNMSVDMSNIFMVADTVFVLHIHNRPFSWVNETVYNTLMNLDDYSITILFDTEEKSRFACGRLVQSMVDEMKNKIKGSLPKWKINFYSAHDTTVACLLSAFKSFDSTRPAYASSVIVELYNSTGDFYVKVWYKYGPLVKASGGLLCNSTSNKTFHNTEECLRPLTIPGCSNFRCPFKEFVQAVSNVMPTSDEWNRECGLSVSDPDKHLCVEGKIFISFTVFLIVAVIVVVVILVVVCCANERKAKHSMDKDNPT